MHSDLFYYCERKNYPPEKKKNRTNSPDINYLLSLGLVRTTQRLVVRRLSDERIHNNLREVVGRMCGIQIEKKNPSERA